MADLIVRLYDLPELSSSMSKMKELDIEIRRPMPFESRIVVKWVEDNYGQSWAMQAQAAFYNQPISCFMAVKNNSIIGFAAYDATCINFFGPTGVLEEYQGRGIGKSLLLQSMAAMRENGYAYAIVGGAGPIDYYKKTLDAQEIHKSTPGIYANRIDSA
ncbi:MAG: GNAT family N-acetyltransferase [Sedimentisphaeraceae bacterium JB056]